MSRVIKYYTVKVSKPGAYYKNIWYAKLEGKTFKTSLATVENGGGKMVSVFKCVEAPFYHIYPIHCTILKEESITIKT